MKYFRNSISIILFIKLHADIITVASESISEKNQLNIRYFSCIIIRKGGDVLPAASIASITVRDHQFSELTE